MLTGTGPDITSCGSRLPMPATSNGPTRFEAQPVLAAAYWSRFSARCSVWRTACRESPSRAPTCGA